MMKDFLISKPTKPLGTLILAHGAGAPMDTPFMDYFSSGLTDAGLRVIRFEFPYMARRRTTGKKGGPGSANRLLGDYVKVVDQVSNQWPKSRILIGGKSMGGRIASMIADDVDATGIVCLGYPFHPPGKPDNLRTEHLQTMKTPTLIIQGTRDPFGTENEVPEYDLAKKVSLHWLADGDHSFKPRKSSGRTEEQNWSDGVTAIAKFAKKRLK